MEQVKVDSLVSEFSRAGEVADSGGVLFARLEALKQRLQALKDEEEVEPPAPKTPSPGTGVVPKAEHLVVLRHVEPPVSRVVWWEEPIAPPLPSHVPLPPLLPIPAKKPVIEVISVEDILDEEHEAPKPKIDSASELRVKAREIVTIARSSTKTDLPDVSDLAAQATMIHVLPFKDVNPIENKQRVLASCAMLLLTFSRFMIARRVVAAWKSVLSRAAVFLLRSDILSRVVRFASRQAQAPGMIQASKPFLWLAATSGVKAIVLVNKLFDIRIKYAQAAWIVTIAYSYFCRRAVWYTPLSYTRLESAYDVRNVADMARPVVFANPLYRKFRVTELSGNMFEDLWSFVSGQLTREVTVSMELFASLQSCRQQLLSMKGKASKDLMTGLCRNAELHDTLNIDRYMAVERVHLNTVYLAYHQLMSEERHKAEFF
jgi:hypothetical protein